MTGRSDDRSQVGDRRLDREVGLQIKWHLWCTTTTYPATWILPEHEYSRDPRMECEAEPAQGKTLVPRPRWCILHPLKTPDVPNGMKLTSLQPQAPASLTPGRKIFNAAASVAVCSAIAGLGSTAKELVVARWFGRGDALDAFLIAFLLPSFLVNLVAGSFNSAVIPTFIQVREREGKEAAQRLFSGVMVVSLGLLVGVSILVGILAPYFLPLLGSGFSPAKLMLTRRLLYALLPFIALSGLAVTWTAVLNAGEQFGLPALSAILTPLSIIAFLLLLGRSLGYFCAWPSEP